MIKNNKYFDLKSLDYFILAPQKSVIYQKLQHPFADERQIEVVVKRLDLLHPVVQGNKFYKLHYNLKAAKALGYTRVLTFGGAYSNHIHATALAAAANGLQSIGIIRGEIVKPLNPTLEDAERQGMIFYPMNRGDYRQKENPSIFENLKLQFGDFYLIPEGGTNALAIKGTKEILAEQDLSMDFICTPIGTGGTFAGLVDSAKPEQHVIGFSALKGEFIFSEIEQLLQKYDISPKCRYTIETAYHFGGYAKHNAELITFIQELKEKAKLPADPIYTGKMMFGLLDLIGKNYFPNGSKILVLHTGGLQGVRGFEQRLGIQL